MAKFDVNDRVKVVKGFHSSVRRLIGRTGTVIHVHEASFGKHDLTIYTVQIGRSPIDLWSEEIEKLEH